MATKFQITRTRGDSIYAQVTVTKNGEIVNLTGKELIFTGKLSRKDSDLNAVFQKTLSDGIVIINAALGVAQIRVAPADTNEVVIVKTAGAAMATTAIYCDCQMKDVALSDVHTISEGIIDLEEDTTRVQ